MRALSVYINTNTENSVDSIENSFGSVEYWLIKINFEKFLELMEKSLLLLSFQFVGKCCPTELDMIWIEKMFPFIAKDGNSLSMAEFDQFMKKAKIVFQDVSKFLPLYSGFQVLPEVLSYKEEDIKKVFRGLDLNKDGQLSLEEMMIGLNNKTLRDFSLKYVIGRKKCTYNLIPIPIPSPSESESEAQSHSRQGKTGETSF